jgi:crotonobetainyl-CoA:carnitine CoA-transferase CaiB-like acyl-CoA transferase
VSAPLRGLSVLARGDDPAVATCVRHLERLGATPVSEGGADIVLVAESHQLLGGGLVASETTAQAALGLTDYVGAHDGEPTRTGMDVASCVAGFCGALRVLAAVHGGVERPIEIGVSALRALSTLKTILWAARSRPDAWTGTHVRSRERQVDSGYATRDRPITLDFALYAEAGWRSFMDELGVEAATVERLAPRWSETFGWGDDVDDARPIYEAALRTRDSDEAMALIRRHGGSSVPFLELGECLAHPQSRALQLERSLADGLPWRLRGADGPPAPLGGAAPAAQPLRGVRVVDFGVGGVGPFAAALLAGLGADVVKVEAPNEFILSVRPSVGGLSTTYLALNQGKRSVSLDLKDPEDHRLARGLVADADVVLENFRPGVLERLGFGYDALRALNPGVVFCSATGYGWAGPLVAEPCTDPHMQAFGGFAAGNADPVSGRPRRVRYYGFVDLVTSSVIAEAIAAALVVRDREGGSVRVETSMLHAVVEAQRPGPRACPDGLFATADGHVALTCRDDEDWQRLLSVLERPASLCDPALAAGEGRRTHRARIDAALAPVLATLPAAAWAHALGRAGVPCVRAAGDEEAMARRDLWDWGVLRELPLAHADSLIVAGPPWPPDGGPPASAPLPGADTPRLRDEPSEFWAARAERSGAGTR